MKTSQPFLWIFLLTVGFGCQRSKGPGPAEEPPVAEGSSPHSATPSSPNVSVVPEAAPNRYHVVLDFPAEAGRNLWLVRHAPHFPAVVLGQLTEAGASFTDRQVEAGEVYRYTLHDNQPSPQLPTWESRVVIPLDLEINGEFITRGVSAVNRLFLRAGGRLRAEESPLVIQVNEILSEGGTIETNLFPTAMGQTGRAGSDLVIIAKTASGILHINGRGDRGGAGLQGKPGTAGQTGAAGSAGEIAIRYRNNNPIYRDNLPRFIDQLENKLEALDPYFKELYDCQRAPGNGGDGHPGATGGPGGMGGKGGRGSHLFVAIENAAAAQIIAQSLPGLGGNGGDGGEGGPGGAGGPAGTQDKHHICSPAKAGNQGPHGPRGVAGEPGEPGERGKTCLVLNGAAVGDCKFFVKYVTPSGLALGSFLRTLAP